MAILVFLFILGLMLPYIDQFAYPVQSSYSDVTISHYPNLHYFQRSLAGGSLPLWSNTILSGYPFAANPLSGMWYPPLWLALLFQGATGLNIVVALHLLLGAYGMLLFLWEDGQRYEVALLGAVAFQLMPKVQAHYAAGHITMVCAVMWTPWLLWALRRYRERPGYHAAMLSGVILGLTALADLRWAAFAGALWLVFSLYLFFGAAWAKWKNKTTAFWKDAAGWCLKTGMTVVLAFGLSAPQLLPLMTYSPLTTRSLLTPEDNLVFALPFERVINLLFPDIGGYAEFVIYPGALILLFFVSAVVDQSIWKKRGFWFAVFIVSGIYAFGDLFVLNRVITRLPGFSLLRVPSRALFISNLAAIMIFCEALAAIYDRQGLPQKQKKIKILMTSIVMMLAVMLTIGLRVMVGEAPFEMAYGSIMLVLAFVLFVLLAQGVFRGQSGYAAMIAILVLDMGTTSHSSTAFWTFDKATAQGAEAAAYLAKQEGVFRVYSPSYSLPQHTAELYGLELADGIDPLQLQVYSAYMENATGVDSPGYSVTIPAFVGGGVATANKDAVPDAEMLGKLNVRFVVADFDISAPGLMAAAQFGETRIYEIKRVYPRAWVQTAEAITPAEFIVSTPNEIRLKAVGRGTVVVSELMYPGWRVMVDGIPREIVIVDGMFRGVEISKGSHEIVFCFQPKSVYAGCGIGFAAWFIVGLYAFYSIRKQRSG